MAIIRADSCRLFTNFNIIHRLDASIFTDYGQLEYIHGWYNYRFKDLFIEMKIEI